MQLFEKVEVHKPPASRSTSAETYLLAFKYKAAAKIDPRILDVKYLFQGAIEPPRKVILIRNDKPMTSLSINSLFSPVTLFLCINRVV